MTALVFLFAVAVIFGAVLFVEAGESGADQPRRPIGLISWLTGGNWPAKIGGGLLVVGIGSLLRYGLINFDVAPSIKLGIGIVAAGLLALGATLTRIGKARRAVSLALAGAAFGVAYLTAYSAFALFNYLDSPTGIGLLALTAVGAGVYAITRGALSLALLAMVGAYLAPAFAVSDPGPKVVYGYYAAASLLTLVMVAVRGWRPLIHLSFLFTLAGGVFFAWTAQYYDNPAYADVMLPAIWILAAIHLVMPLAETRAGRGVWIERLDLVYLLALPSIVALLAVVVAPSRDVLSQELLALSALWIVAAVYLHFAKREGMALHAVIGVLLVGFGVAARYRNLPWELIALAFSVGALAIAAKRSASRRLHSALAGLVPLLGFLHIVSTLSPVAHSPVFRNGRFVERLIAAGLMITAAWICRSIRNSLDTLLWTVGIGWALITIGSELVRWDLVSLASIVHWAFVLAAVLLAVAGERIRATSALLGGIAIGVLVTSAWAAIGAPLSVSWASLAVAPLALIWMSVRRGEADTATQGGRLLSAIAAPIAATVWAIHVAQVGPIDDPRFALSAGVAAALLVVLAARALPARSYDWIDTVGEIIGITMILILLNATILSIARGPWAVVLELISLATLAVLASSNNGSKKKWLGPACAFALALVLQAHLLRWLGPPGPLSIGDITRMEAPTVVSLLWAMMGGVLTVWGRHRAVRALWIAGACLLVAAAVKLVLVDFGSLGQLANILAVIAAGVVFLLVGWLAPMPPAAAPVPKPEVAAAPLRTPAPEPSPAAAPPPAASTPPRPQVEVKPGTNEYQERNQSRAAAHPTSHAETDRSNKRIAWTIAILAAIVLPMVQCSRSAREAIRRNLHVINSVPHQASPVPQPGIASQATLETPMTELEPPVVENACTQWAARLPADYEVYAAGAYGGRDLEFAMDDSNHRATAFDVAVHLPDRNVVLVLGAYEPAVWTVKWSRATHIVGVWVSGYYAQQITGLQADTPVLRTSYAEHGACSYFYVSEDGIQQMSRSVASVLGRAPRKLVMASAGQVNIGNTDENSFYVQGEVRPVEAFRDTRLPLAGDLGIEELIKEGKLRYAHASDLEMLNASALSGQPVLAAMTRRDPRTNEPFRTFVVIAPMTIPVDLYGANSVTFIVPRGVPRPQGNPGHSRVLDLND